MSRARVFLIVIVLALAGACGPRLNPEQQSLRTETRLALLAHSYERAADLGRRVVHFLPQENDAWEDLVQAQLGLRDFAAAEKTLQDWRLAIPADSLRRLERNGDLALAQQDSARALEFWNKALLLQPRRARLLRKIAELHRADGRWAEEDAALSSILSFADNASDRVHRALARRRLHRWSDALADARRAQELEPIAPEVRAASKLFEHLGRFLSAIQDLDARLAITPGDDQLLTDRALLFLRSGDPELALADSEAAAKLAPWAMRPPLFSGLALIQLGRTADAEAAAINPRFELDSLTPEFLETISRLDAEISVERNNAELHVTRAWQLNDIGQPALALRDAENALRFDPKSAGAHAECAYAQNKLGRGDEAFAHIQRATELDANFSTAWHYRGELEMSRGEYEHAVASLTRALAINQTAATLQKREECYIQLGQLEKAEADHRALEALR